MGIERISEDDLRKHAQAVLGKQATVSEYMIALLRAFCKSIGIEVLDPTPPAPKVIEVTLSELQSGDRFGNAETPRHMRVTMTKEFKLPGGLILCTGEGGKLLTMDPNRVVEKVHVDENKPVIAE